MDLDFLEKLQNNPENPALTGSAYQMMQLALDPEVSLNDWADVIMKDIPIP